MQAAAFCILCNFEILQLREAIHETIAIVQPTCDKRMDKSYYRQSCDSYFLILLKLCR